MRSFDAAVVGGGASGLMAAACLAKRGLSTAVLEGADRVGKKLLSTGNGRCNLTNLNMSPSHYHGDGRVSEIIKNYPAERIISAFNEMGLYTRSDTEGRVYPASFQAAAVLNLLRARLKQYGAEEICGFPVREIKRTKSGFEIIGGNGDSGSITAERVILSTGGRAAAGGGAGYALLESLGHSVKELAPALAPVRTDKRACRALKGLRVKAGATLLCGGKKLHSEQGEVIFGDAKLSGICIMNHSSRLYGLSGGAEIALDLLYEDELREAAEHLKKMRASLPSLPASEIFSGTVNIRVGQELCREAGVAAGMRAGELSDEKLNELALLAKNWRFPALGVFPFKDAQCTMGGVPLDELDLSTMESKKCPGLYLTGELLDVCGDCGGYNLHFAWATGIIAGGSCAAGMPAAGGGCTAGMPLW